MIDIKKGNNRILTKEKYNNLLEKVKKSKSKVTGKSPEDYQRLKRYDIIKVDECEKLIYPLNGESSNIRYYVHTEELFNIIHETHLSIGHGGRNRMMKELQKKYKNITCEEVMVYLNLCEYCQMKSKVSKKGIVVQPVTVQEMNSRCEVDFIDMQSQPDQDYKFILVYQDDLTKFIQLRPLKTKCAKEVAHVLIDIFTIFGAPSVLQNDNDLEFCNQVIEEACAMWTELKIIYDKPNYSQSQGSIEHANQEVENMLSSWLESNQTQSWTEGLRFVQFMKNRTYHEGIKCSPYEAMFNSPLKAWLKTSSFHIDAVTDVRIEEELQVIYEPLDQHESQLEGPNENISEKSIKNEQPSFTQPEVIIPDSSFKVNSNMEMINFLQSRTERKKLRKSE